ncbi:flagellar hook-associated protein FlgK [Mixta theicola]|uniref:Flagellar hook-associated protein 1 n=1 Tax=Mixta theicola TaxID=1458355 RepID=A0A2K1Q8A3_9GAMM|nr:flagellar hook-associated protein FlgK [Mixta theicola]PNS11207.1 flagellar hook-associated protein FlgK [Mixta theicola]GLR07527.1 flagellar hook-associated protein 1 [Mixta theicola]
MNLMYLAQSGLSAAQSSLNVVGNNLNNAYTVGYSRQNIILGEAGGKTTANGFFGYGVQVNGVKRAYDAFINNQLRGAQTEYSALSSRYEQLSQIDNMLGDKSNNVSVSINNIFGALEKMSSDPVSMAARQEAMSQFKATAYQFQSSSRTLNGLEKSTNTQINQTVNDINSCAKELATVNAALYKIHAQTGGQPADLLDQRDLLLNKLSNLVGVTVDENQLTGEVKVSLSNGLPLVNGDRTCLFEATPSAANPARLEVSYIDASGNPIKLDEEKISSGKLGGLFKFRNEDLIDARNQLNQLALQMANRFNEVNTAGFDIDGEAGGDIFTIADPSALVNRNNQGDASLDISFSDIPQVKAQDYTVVYQGPGANDWLITDSSGREITPDIGSQGELSFDGITIQPQGTPEAGDSFILNPVGGVAENIAVAISSGDKIAASSSADIEEESNNENIKDMIAIKNETLVGKATLTEAYASLVSSVGSAVNSLEGNKDVAENVYDQLAEQQQNVAGVDPTEEYLYMQMYTQYYQANAQVLQTATTIFDALLNIR